MKRTLHALIATATLWLLLATGCSTPSATMEHGSGGKAATCLVCQHNNDLACVCVKVTDATPKAEYDRQTYYFCSDDCRVAFLKKPEKYLPKDHGSRATR